MEPTTVVDVVIKADGSAYVETVTGENSGITPRCLNCRHSSVSGCSVKCLLGVYRYAEINRKLSHTEETARAWAEPEYSAPHVTEKELCSGDQGIYQVTPELIGRGWVSTPTIREVVESACSSAAFRHE